MLDVNLSTFLNNPNSIVEYKLDIFDPMGAVPSFTVPAGDILQLTTEHAIFADALSIGNVYEGGANITLSGVTISSNSVISPFLRFKNGYLTSDWLPLGVYYIYERSDTTDGLTFLICNDKIMDTEIGIKEALPALVYPLDMQQMVSVICRYLGVELDNRTVIKADMYVQEPGDISMRAVLSYIAAAHGGNFHITREGKLRLVPLRPADTEIKQEVKKAVVNHANLNSPVQITGVKLYLDTELFYMAGNNSGTVLTSQNPWATQSMADYILTQVNDFTFYAFESENAFVSPALEIGDCISVCDTLVVLAKMNTTDELLFCPDISLPSLTDSNVSYPYEGTLMTEVRRLTRILGNLAVEGTVISEGLYAQLGDIANLTVSALSTHTKIAKYINKDTTAINYVEIYDNAISLINGSVVFDDAGNPTTTQLTTQDGKPIYWDANVDEATVVNGHYEIDGVQVVTTRKVTDWPVMVYAYNTAEKANFTFNETSGVPVLNLGAGNGNGSNGKAKIMKTPAGLIVDYTTTAGNMLYLFMGDDGRIVTKDTLSAIDISTIDDGKFTMTYAGGAVEYGFESTSTGYKLTKPEGQVIEIVC